MVEISGPGQLAGFGSFKWCFIGTGTLAKQVAKDKKVYMCEAMWTWFAKPANRVKEWISEGKIGKVEEVNFTYCMNSINYSPRVATIIE